MSYTRRDFGTTVRNDFMDRRRSTVELSVRHQDGIFSKSMEHPLAAPLEVGRRRTDDLAVGFLDLTNFTSRSFWDDQDDVVTLAHAVLTGFTETVERFGGYPLGLRGDGLFFGFGPHADARIACTMALGAAAFAMDAVEHEVNPWLQEMGWERVQARAGLDFGPVTSVRTGHPDRNEINPTGFAINFAAKCEKYAKSWEIVTGEGMADRLAPDLFATMLGSPKRYERRGQVRTYHFYQYAWRRTLGHLDDVIAQINGYPVDRIQIG